MNLLEEDVLPVLGDEAAQSFGYEVWGVAETLAKRLIDNNRKGGVKASLRVEACDSDGNVIGVIERDALTTKQFAQLTQINMFALASVVMTDTANATHTENANTAATSPLVAAGTSGTAAAFADHVLGTETETVAATVNAISSNTYTITGTITATANRAYQEVGVRITVNTHLYLLMHDTFSTQNVNSGGTLAVTYTLTFT